MQNQNHVRFARRLTLLVTMAAGLAAGLAASARAADWKDALQTALESKYKVTKTGWDRLRVTAPGTVFILKQEGVRADLATDMTLYPNTVDPASGQIAQAGGAVIGMLGGKETSRALPAGEELYLFKIDVGDREVKYQLLTTKTYQVTVKGSTKELRYKALVVFPFEQGALPGLDADAVAKVTRAIVMPKEEALAEASQPRTISIGQTQAEVEAILGKPERIFNLGPKVTYAYKDMRVVFVDGKVADVQ